MLATTRDTSFPITCHDNVVDETWHRRDTSDEEGRNSAPVRSNLGLVAVHSMEVIHVRYGDLAAADNVVAKDVKSVHAIAGYHG